MLLSVTISLLLAFGPAQSEGSQPAYAREGDRVEQEFRVYRDKLAEFFNTLRRAMDQPPAVSVQLPRPQDPPPPPAVYGYGVLPRIVDAPSANGGSVSTFSYSWVVTEGYIRNEEIKLEQVQSELNEAMGSPADLKETRVANLVTEYRKLVANQRTVDQYVQYNRFWQRTIADDRPRFDQLTKAYELMTGSDPDVAQAIRDVLGKPETPAFIEAEKDVNHVVIRVPVYTDIQDSGFLSRAKQAIEEMWQAHDGETAYVVEVQFRNVSLPDLYREESVPQQGEHLNVRTHAARFPSDGAVLTTGAQTTHSLVGRYVALAPGDLSTRTLAHEFGHVLGFRDGYIRGYRDLGDRGFEILELTSVFDDLMSAPREGHVQPAHFKLLIEAKGK